MKGVAYTPNGKIYAIIQSPADNPTVAVGNTGRLVRMVEIDPQTDEVRQFVYEMNPETGQIRTRDWKVGDLVAVNNNEFLLVEHAERNGWNVKNIYKIDISGATALTTEDFGGQTLEQVGNASGLAAFGVNVVQKEFVFDLLEAGWDLSHDKPEGLTIINDSTIAVVNDNDFGIDSPAGDGSVTFTGKTTRLYIFGLSNPLGYEFPLCSYTIPVSTQETCEGQAVVLDAGPGYAAYLWSDGSTSQTLETTDAGIYSVIVTDEAGCKASDETELIVWPLPTVNLGNDTLISTLETLVLDAGAGFDTYLWSDGSDGQTLEVLETGAYSVTVTDANGCIGTDEVIVTVINSVKDLAVGGQLNLFPNPSSGLVNLTFKEFIPGNYTLVLMDITGRPLLNREINIQSEMETQPVDLSSFPKGSYVLRIGSGQGTWIKS
ncbi:MAG: esterase-like activity of phytase family protein [Saprospirales bacterium]|nr:esterase-like activity of phytase family protein [Saprospirales bacterium]